MIPGIIAGTRLKKESVIPTSTIRMIGRHPTQGLSNLSVGYIPAASLFFDFDSGEITDIVQRSRIFDPTIPRIFNDLLVSAIDGNHCICISTTSYRDWGDNSDFMVLVTPYTSNNDLVLEWEWIEWHSLLVEVEVRPVFIPNSQAAPTSVVMLKKKKFIVAGSYASHSSKKKVDIPMITYESPMVMDNTPIVIDLTDTPYEIGSDSGNDWVTPEFSVVPGSPIIGVQIPVHDPVNPAAAYNDVYAVFAYNTDTLSVVGDINFYTQVDFFRPLPSSFKALANLGVPFYDSVFITDGGNSFYKNASVSSNGILCGNSSTMYGDWISYSTYEQRHLDEVSFGVIHDGVEFFQLTNAISLIEDRLDQLEYNTLDEYAPNFGWAAVYMEV